MEYPVCSKDCSVVSVGLNAAKARMFSDLNLLSEERIHKRKCE